MKNSVKQELTDKLLEMMETHGEGWIFPWVKMSQQRNADSKRAYTGINAFLTAYVANENSYKSPFWATYRGWAKLGYQVKKGAKATEIVFWSKFEKNEIDAQGHKVVKQIPYVKYYHIFNAAQLTTDFEAPESEKPDGADSIDKVDQAIADTKAAITFGGDRACYSPSRDAIKIPEKKQFHSTERFYSVMLHELGHWTGHTSRLNRSSLNSFYVKSEYAAEEFVAEISAMFSCVALGIQAEPTSANATYLNCWKKALKEEKNFIIKAFSLAQKASDYILEKKEDN